MEIAVFALALAVWTYPGSEGYRSLPQMNVACCGLSVGSAKRNGLPSPMAMQPPARRLPGCMTSIGTPRFWVPCLIPKRINSGVHQKKLSGVCLRQTAGQGASRRRIGSGSGCQGTVDATLILMNEYDLVITNVPYLARENKARHCKNTAKFISLPPRTTSPPCSWTAACNSAIPVAQPASCCPRIGSSSSPTRNSARNC